MKLEFSLTYANIPFLPDSAQIVRLPASEDKFKNVDILPPRDQQPLADLCDELNRIIPLSQLQEYSPLDQFAGPTLGALATLNQEGMDPPPNTPIGSFWYPRTAARWSVFRMLATSSIAKVMLDATGGTSPQTLSMTCKPDQPNPQASYSITSPMYMLPPRPMAEHGGQFDGLYLITLVDDRYYGQFKSSSLRVKQDTTWQNLIDQLASDFGVAITPFSIASVYGQPEPDSQFWTNQESTAILLDAVAYCLGRVVVRGFDGTYTLQSVSDSQALVDSNRGNATGVVRLAGGDLFYDGSAKLKVGDLTEAKNAVVPATVTVTFPKYVTGDVPVPHMLNSRYGNQRQSCWYEDSYGDTYSTIIPIQSCGPVVADLIGVGDHTIANTCKALYSDEASGPTNSPSLQALALQLATDYYGWQVGSGLDEVYPGTVEWTPEGFDDIVFTWSVRSRLASTRVMHGEWNQTIDRMQHATQGGITNTPKGVGGPSVAQSWIDQASQSVSTTLASTLNSGDIIVPFTKVDCFPTQNRWRGTINDGVNNEAVMFEGTSGQTSVGVVFRGIDCTVQPLSFAPGAVISWTQPDASYGDNLVRLEKMLWAMPSEWSSGGMQGVNVIPQTQTVYTYSASGVIIGGRTYYSGQLQTYDTTGASFPNKELIWIDERNLQPVLSGKRYDGQFAGWSQSGRVAPVYLVNEYPVASGSVASGSYASGSVSWYSLASGIGGYSGSTVNYATIILPPNTPATPGEETIKNCHIQYKSDDSNNYTVPRWPTGTTVSKGDLLTGTTTNTEAKLAVGTDTYVLTADSAQATGLKWAPAAGTGTVTSVDMSVPPSFTIAGNPVTTNGTLALAYDAGVFTTGGRILYWNGTGITITTATFNGGTGDVTTANDLTAGGTVRANTNFNAGGTAGFTGTFATGDARTVTVKFGIITNVA